MKLHKQRILEKLFRSGKYSALRDGSILTRSDNHGGLRVGVGRPLKPSHAGKKPQYGKVVLVHNGLRFTFQQHQVVWLYFKGAIPDGLEINHKNGKTYDNSLGNLEAVTRSENERHAYRLGLKKRSLSPEQVRGVCRLRDKGWTYERIRKKYKVAAGTVWKAVNVT